MGSKRIRFARLEKIFAANEKRQFHEEIAHLCVLYEDLRIEIFGIQILNMPDIDVLDSEHENRFSLMRQIGSYKRYYFVRRSIGTLREFTDALDLINRDENLGLPRV